MCLCIYSIVVAGPSVVTSLFLLALVYLYVIRRYERRWWVRREFEKRPDKNSDIEWLINADKLQIKSSLMEAELIWSAFVQVVQTRDGFIFYSNEGVFNFFPKRGFQNDSEFQRLAQLAEKHAKNFSKMS